MNLINVRINLSLASTKKQQASHILRTAQVDERIATLVCWPNADKTKDARRRPRLFYSSSNPPEIPSTGPPHWSSGMRRPPPPWGPVHTHHARLCLYDACYRYVIKHVAWACRNFGLHWGACSFSQSHSMSPHARRLPSQKRPHRPLAGAGGRRLEAGKTGNHAV